MSFTELFVNFNLQLLTVVCRFNMFSELVQGLFELMENNLLPVLDMMTCQGERPTSGKV